MFRDPSGRHVSTQQGTEILVQQTVVRIEFPTCLFESRQPVTERFFHHRRRQTIGLIEQGAAAAVAAELVVRRKELFPPGVPRRDRVDVITGPLYE